MLNQSKISNQDYPKHRRLASLNLILLYHTQSHLGVELHPITHIPWKS